MSTLIYTRNKNGRAILAISNKQATERIELETTAYFKTCNYFTNQAYKWSFKFKVNFTIKSLLFISIFKTCFLHNEILCLIIFI